MVLWLPLDIHPSRVPIAILGCGLRPPMIPDAKFGVAKPIGCAISIERFAVCGEQPGRNLRRCARVRSGTAGSRPEAQLPKWRGQASSGGEG